MVDLYLFRTALRDLARPKRLLVAAALMALPAAFALLWRFSAPDDFDAYDAYNTLAAVLVYGFLLVILAVVFGTGVVTQEIEQKTIGYLLTRPVPRWRILLMKFAAAFVGIAATTMLASLLLALATFGGGGAQVSALLRVSDVHDPTGLITRIKTNADPVSTYLHRRMGDRLRATLRTLNTSRPIPDRIERNVVRQINNTLRGDAKFYDSERFADMTLRPETQALLAKKQGGRERIRLNRLLLEDAFPTEITPRTPSTVAIPRDLAILCVGAVAYGALFLLLATLMNRPLMVGLIFAFGWETWVPNMPGSFQKVSIMTYLRVLAPHPQPPAESVDLIQFLSGTNQETISSMLSWGVLLAAIAVMLGGALLLFSRREYVPREDAE